MSRIGKEYGSPCSIGVKGGGVVVVESAKPYLQPGLNTNSCYWKQIAKEVYLSLCKIKQELRGYQEVRGDGGRVVKRDPRSVKDCRDWFTVFKIAMT